MKHTKKVPTPRSGAAKFPGITDDARKLGVSRNHLYFVLSGRRISARLMSSYQKLKAA